MAKLKDKKMMMAKKMAKQKGKQSLNPAFSKTGKNEGNNLYEGLNEQERM